MGVSGELGGVAILKYSGVGSLTIGQASLGKSRMVSGR